MYSPWMSKGQRQQFLSTKLLYLGEIINKEMVRVWHKLALRRAIFRVSMWNNPQKSSGYPYGTIPKSRDITSGSRIETAIALFLQWFTARLLGCFISGLYILRDLDRIVCFNHLLYCSGCFMLRHISHIFIMDSWVWTITGDETSLLLFIHFTWPVTLSRSSLLLQLSSNKFIRVNIYSKCLFLWFQVGFKLWKRGEEERGELFGVVSHPFALTLTYIMADVWDWRFGKYVGYLACLRRLIISYLAQILSGSWMGFTVWQFKCVQKQEPGNIHTIYLC